MVLGEGMRWRWSGSAVRAVALSLAVAAVVAGAAVAMAGVASRSQRAAVRGSRALPVGAWGLVSRTLGRDDRRFAVRWVGGRWVARNPVQGLDLSFGRAGVVVRSGHIAWALGLRAVG